MNALELIQVMSQDPKTRDKFCGVYASDTLPKVIENYPCGLIVNTDPQTEKGSHWLALYFPNREMAEFFDSYGNPPDFYQTNFKNFLNSHSRQWTYNHRCLQSLSSSMCGQFCVYFLINRMLLEIVKSFSSNLTVNDQRVSHYVRRLLIFSKHQKRTKRSQSSLTRVQNKTK